MLIQIKSKWSDKILFEGVEGANLTDADLSGANLSGANLSGADLRDADLRDADLSGADLSGADLSGADLRDADLSGADLSGADLSGADLRDADLSGADLSDADLRDADLTGANLSDADLRDADLTGANLSDADLEHIKVDLICAIMRLPDEIPNLRQKFIEGKIDGSTYSGECSCLAGTIANHLEISIGLLKDNFRFPVCASSPRERFAMSVRPGDTPENSSIAKLFVEWIDEALWMVNNIRKVS